MSYTVLGMRPLGWQKQTATIKSTSSVLFDRRRRTRRSRLAVVVVERKREVNRWFGEPVPALPLLVQLYTRRHPGVDPSSEFQASSSES